MITVKKGTEAFAQNNLSPTISCILNFVFPKAFMGKGRQEATAASFANTGKGDAGYELQVLDNYNNSTYVNGQVGSIYKQSIPLANPSRKPGEWQVYDVAWTAPRFNNDGSLKSPAKVTVFLNGVLVQNNYILKGVTAWIGYPYYSAWSMPDQITRSWRSQRTDQFS